MAGNRRAGIIQFKINGEVYDVKGDVEYSPGLPAREAIIGQDGVHGYNEKVTVPFCELTLTDSGDISLEALGGIVDATLTLALANGKTFVLRNAWACNPDGLKVTTEEGAIKQRFEGKGGDEI